MRSVRMAIWTSGEPVSLSLVAKLLITSCLRSVVSDIELSFCSGVRLGRARSVFRMMAGRASGSDVAPHLRPQPGCRPAGSRHGLRPLERGSQDRSLIHESTCEARGNLPAHATNP